jgi:hypothetical protein
MQVIIVSKKNQINVSSKFVTVKDNKKRWKINFPISKKYKQLLLGRAIIFKFFPARKL